LDGHVRIRSAALVFSDQALSAYDCRPAEMCGFGARVERGRENEAEN
jgi:hypothetical protein